MNHGRTVGALLISLFIAVGALLPKTASAGVLADFVGFFVKKEVVETPSTQSGNVQTMELLRPAHNIVPAPARGGGDVVIVDESALLPAEGPSGTLATIEKPHNATISTYVVRPGDTVSGIAEMFDVSPSTIRWANDLPPAATIRVGQTLTILPVTGVRYTIKQGDTLASLAKKFDADASEIANFNEIEGSLAVGTEIIIPDGEIAPAPEPAKKPKPSSGPARSSTPAIAAVRNDGTGRYTHPLPGSVRTQGVHGYNAVDLAAPVGTPIYAAAAGSVITAKPSGWNGGYGDYVVIQHADGSQTLYAHASKLAVEVGENVGQGQVIAYVGSTGKSTGSHLHFEIRNGVRNPF